MDAIVKNIADAMNASLGAPLTVFLLSIIPIAEARLAIPLGIGMGLSPMEAFGWAFLGSSLMAPILILTFIPIINALSRTRFFSRIGKFLYDKFEKRSRAVKVDESNDAEKNSKRITKSDVKKICGVSLFVAVPLPLTGVWTGSAVASILKIGFVKSLIGVISGNIVACGIITLISYLFEEYVFWITFAFAVIAVVVVIILIIKFLLYKPKTQSDENDSKEQSGDDTNI